MLEESLDPVVVERRLKRRMAMLALQQRFASLLSTPVYPERTALWSATAKHIGPQEAVTVLDFGVYRGRSTSFWATNFKNPASRFHGFDSFEGLPSDWTPNMPKGTFSTGGQIPELNDARVKFHKGWIQNTLPGFLESGALNENKTVIVHVDTDIYSAALFILTSVWHYLDKFYVVFDEFGVDENLAFNDFAESYPVEIEFFGHTLNEKFKTPAQVFGAVTKIEYK